MARRLTAASDDKARSQAGTGRKPHVTVPLFGTFTVPEPDRLVFYAVLGVLGALEVIDWPVVAAIGVAHLLVDQHRFPILREAGEVTEEVV
ncbi:hypothetical protein [Streptosporangium sp. CA-115845]|uniref:hypothetical protein n=1 Tax=Streptosporangium sp. CA-115845 TaxID=3240071 RepID=UPI003D93BAC7